jgi:hypothetical protein
LWDLYDFTFNDLNPRLTNIVREWLGKYFPVEKRQ